MGCLQRGDVEVRVVPHGIRRGAFGPLHCETGSAAASFVERVDRPAGGEPNRGSRAWQNEPFAQTVTEQFPVADGALTRRWPLANVDPSRTPQSDLVSG